MALQSSALSTLIQDKLQAAGFDVGNNHSQLATLTDAIAQAVVEHIQANADVAIASGSSAGSYKVN